MSLEIALATYNGARYLPALLDSLFAQTCQDFEVVVGDDNSDDGTLAVLASAQARYPERIRIVGFGDRSGSAAANFARLSNHLRADYVSYCDQDDVWRAHKVAVSLERIRALESRFGRACPIMVHTDLEIVDSDLRRREASLWRHVSVDPRREALREVLVECSTAGCTMTVNRALRERALPIPPEAVMHDHWLALVAAAFGRIEFIADPCVLYRRHGANSSGRYENGALAFLKRAWEFAGHSTLQRNREGFDGLARQAGAFLARYRSALAPEQRKVVERFAKVPEMGRAYRFATLLREGVLRTSVIRNLALFYVLSRTK